MSWEAEKRENSNLRLAPTDGSRGSAFKKKIGINCLIFDKISHAYLAIVNKVRLGKKKKIFCLDLVFLFLKT